MAAIPENLRVRPPSIVDEEADTGERDLRDEDPTKGANGPGEDVRRGMCDRIERLLKQLTPEVQRDLAEELLEVDKSVIEDRGPLIPELLATLLQPSLSTISSLAAIEDRLCERSDWKMSEIVADIIDEVTPLAIEDELALGLRDAIHHRKSAFFSIPDRHSTTIEVLMACADGKGMKFKPLTNEATGDYVGNALIQPKRKSPIGAPETVESLARSILVDLCEGQSVRDSIAESLALDELVRRLAGVLIFHSPGVNKKRTLYCLHETPARPKERSLHEQAADARPGRI